MDDRTHSASRIILATPRAIFRALIDPEVIPRWRPPAGMTARIFAFDARSGGGYRLALVHEDATGNPGKSTADSDLIRGRFVDLVPDERLVEAVEFEDTAPAFAGMMTITTTLLPVTGGTKVMFVAANVPPGITAADHKAGMASTLKNLANLLE